MSKRKKTQLSIGEKIRKYIISLSGPAIASIISIIAGLVITAFFSPVIIDWVGGIRQRWSDSASANVNIRVEGKELLLPVSFIERGEPQEELALNPYRQFVPLVGRENEMNSLKKFLLSEKNVSVCVLTGTSGSEKERLAFEFYIEAQKNGWKTGYLKASDMEKIRVQSFSCDFLRWNNPTLLVVENAMAFTEPLKKLLSALLDSRSKSKSKLRLLLLAREANVERGWLNDLSMRYKSSTESVYFKEILDPPRPMELPPLGMDARLQLLREALKSCGSSVEIPDTLEFREKLSKAEWSGDPIFLIIAALRMKQTEMPQILSPNRADMTDYYTNTLLAQLDEAARASDVDPEIVRHFVACLALAQEMDRDAFASFYEKEVKRMGWRESATPSKTMGLLEHFFRITLKIFLQ